MTGSFKQQKFYSALQIKSIAQEKHGEKYHGPQSLQIDENDKDEDREDLVNCSTLIHGGNSYNTHLGQATYELKGIISTGNNLTKELVKYFPREFYRRINTKCFLFSRSIMLPAKLSRRIQVLRSVL